MSSMVRYRSRATGGGTAAVAVVWPVALPLLDGLNQ